MKCPNCNGKGKVLDYVAERNCHGEWETVLREIPCDKCQRKPMTNEEYLRTCTTEELAGAIYEWYTLGFTRGKNGVKLNSITEVVDWLKEIHHG